MFSRVQLKWKQLKYVTRVHRVLVFDADGKILEVFVRVRPNPILRHSRAC